MKKAMLSQPMAGKSKEEIIATREKAIKALAEQGYEIVNTLFTDEWYGKEKMEERGVVQIPLCFLAKSLENMALCHAAYFCKGWEHARGCRLEHAAAEAYGVTIIEEAYRPMSGMTFGQAIEAAKAGLKIKRSGWNGKNQYVELASCISYKDPDGGTINAQHDAIGNRALAFCGTSGVQLGWLASQADMLAEDWAVVTAETEE